MRMREMNTKKMENKGKVLLMCLLVAVLPACGTPSGERIAEIQGMYADLVNLHNEVVEVYASLEDDSYQEELDAMAERIDSIGQQDAQEMTSEELNAVVGEMSTYEETYNEMMASMNEMKEGDAGFLDGFQTLNILNLFMEEDEMLWHLEATEESEKVVASVDIDFTGKTDGTTIVIKFSFDSMEGWVEFE